MASIKEIKSHINRIKDTQKITNAMYLIASTKMRKARKELAETRPFFDKLKVEIKRIFRTADDVESRYFYPYGTEDTHEGIYGFLVITADKGMAGAYNINVIRRTEQLIEEHKDNRVFVIGEYGRQYFRRQHIQIEDDFIYTAEDPTLKTAREISTRLLDMYDRGELNKIYIVYTDWKNGITEDVVVTRLLPFHRSQFYENGNEEISDTQFEFATPVSDVLDVIIQTYTMGYIYSALVDSFCSEQNARMTAMDSANKNAEKIIGNLSIQYNRVRQAAITQEITEISAGAKAQKLKKEAVQFE